MDLFVANIIRQEKCGQRLICCVKIENLL